MNTKQDTRKSAREIRADYAAERAEREVAAARRRDRWAARMGFVHATGRALRTLIIFLFFLAIAGFAGWVSYHHIRDLCTLAGWDTATAMATPITIDLTLFVASMQLRRTHITGTARVIARLSMLTGLLLSLGANVLHGWLTASAGLSSFDMGWRLTLSAVPVAMLLAATEMLTHTHKTPKAKSRKARQSSLVRRLMVALVTRVEARNAAPVVTQPTEQPVAAEAIWTVFPGPVVGVTR